VAFPPHFLIAAQPGSRYTIPSVPALAKVLSFRPPSRRRPFNAEIAENLPEAAEHEQYLGENPGLPSLPSAISASAAEFFALTPPVPPKPKKPRRRRKPPVSLSDAQLLALLQVAQHHRTRDWVMILLTYWHETIAMRASDFDLSEWTVKIRRGKGSAGGGDDAPQEQTLQEHENPLLNEREAVAAWLRDRGRFGVKGGAKRQLSALSRQPSGKAKAPVKMRQSTQIVAFSEKEDISAPVSGAKPAGGYEPALIPPLALLGPSAPPGDPPELLFPIGRGQFWRVVHGYALKAGIPRRKCKTHMLKHTIAKHLVRAGHPLNEIQEWMGWTSIETMNWYTRADEEELGNRIGDSIRAKQGLRQVQQGSLFNG
jgi:integrase